MTSLVDPTTVRIVYTNHRGECRERFIIPIQLVFESNEWHTEPQWILYAMDNESGKQRGFAMKDIHSWSPLHDRG